MEIEMIKKSLQQEKIQFVIFASMIKALKTQKQALDQLLSQNTTIARNILFVQPSLKPSNKTKSHNKQDEIDKISNSQSLKSFQGQVDISATPNPSSFNINSCGKTRLRLSSDI